MGDVISARGFRINGVFPQILVKLVELLNLSPEECQDQVVVVDSQDLIVISSPQCGWIE
jgi:hypothetical protein